MSLGYTILVTDDNPETLELLEAYLTLAGYRVLGANDGGQGLEILHLHQVDLILLDIQMPVRDGFSMMSGIRDNPLWSKIPVIFLSSFDRPNLKVKALEMGAEDYVVKPFDKAELLARIKAVLRRSHRFREVESCFHGDLSSISLPILLQTLALSSKSAQIKLPNVQGWIELEDGYFTGAGFAEFTGQEAVLRLIFGARGTFDVEFDPKVFHQQGIRIPVDSLLINIAPTIDELIGMLGKIPDLNARVKVNDGSILNGSYTTIQDAMILLPQDLKQNASHILHAVDDGKIVFTDS